MDRATGRMDRPDRCVIYWPIQATHINSGPGNRGYVRSLARYRRTRLTRSPVATQTWLVARVRHTRDNRVAGPLSDPSPSLALAALLYGLYTGSMFSALVYHAMVDESKAVQRVAVNETLVGVCLLLGSPRQTPPPGWNGL